MKKLERTFEERLAYWMKDPVFREAYCQIEKPIPISLNTFLFVSANKEVDVLDVLLHDQDILDKWCELIHLLTEKCQTDIIIKGTEVDVL